MRIECPSCHTSYPAQLLDRFITPNDGRDRSTLCSVCHHHFDFKVTRSRIPFVTRPRVTTKLIDHVNAR